MVNPNRMILIAKLLFFVTFFFTALMMVLWASYSGIIPERTSANSNSHLCYLSELKSKGKSVLGCPDRNLSVYLDYTRKGCGMMCQVEIKPEVVGYGDEFVKTTRNGLDYINQLRNAHYPRVYLFASEMTFLVLTSILASLGWISSLTSQFDVMYSRFIQEEDRKAEISNRISKLKRTLNVMGIAISTSVFIAMFSSIFTFVVGMHLSYQNFEFTSQCVMYNFNGGNTSVAVCEYQNKIVDLEFSNDCVARSDYVLCDVLRKCGSVCTVKMHSKILESNVPGVLNNGVAGNGLRLDDIGIGNQNGLLDWNYAMAFVGTIALLSTALLNLKLARDISYIFEPAEIRQDKKNE